ncbi:RNA polymerase sigma factor RpoH [Candidatus Hepatincolaceae symbiont of Richtersius coronifer]
MTNKFLSIYNDSELKAYMSAISNIKMLEVKEEYDLAIDWVHNKNSQAANKLVVSHLPLVVKLAYSYKGYGISLIDLISEGNIGLIKAVAKFDPYKGFRLSTYAMWWIKAFMTDYILNSWSLVKSGSLAGRKKLFFSLNKVKARLGIAGKAMTDSDANLISQDMKISKKDVIEVNRMINSKDVYLQSLVYNDNSSTTVIEDTLESNSDTPEELIAKKQEGAHSRYLIKEAFSVLSDREKSILVQRYMSEKPLSLESIGTKLGVSRERVRQIEAGALKKAKSYLASKTIGTNLSVVN